MAERQKPETLEDAVKLIEQLYGEVDEWKGHSRTWEARAKENKDATAERDTLKAELDKLQKSLPETERLKADLESVKAQVASESEARRVAELSALKARIGAAKGLPPQLIDRLSGDDEDSITADAESLLSVISTIDIGQGARGSAAQTPADPLLGAVTSKLGIST